MTSCTKGEKSSTIKMMVANNSNHDVEMIIYNDDNDFNYENHVSTFLIPAMSQELICTYRATDFFAFRLCQPEHSKQIVFRFPNRKGFYCPSYTADGTGNSLCFDRDNFSLDDFSLDDADETYYSVQENEYIFEITQDDYENAHELPE